MFEQQDVKQFGAQVARSSNEHSVAIVLLPANFIWEIGVTDLEVLLDKHHEWRQESTNSCSINSSRIVFASSLSMTHAVLYW